MEIHYFDGQFLSESEVKIPPSDRGFLFGDGAFATIQVKEGVPLFLEEHLVQLKKNCSSLNIQLPPLKKEIIEELILKNGAEEGIWKLRIIITGGDHKGIGLPQREGRELIHLHPFTPDPFKALHLEPFSQPNFICHAYFKSLAHLSRFYVMEEARQKEVDDCVTFTEKGVLLEAAFGNLFFIKDKHLFTPDPQLPINFGITIKNILKLAQKLGFEMHYVQWKEEDLPQDAAAFRTNSMQGIRPIARLGKHSFMQNVVLETLFINGYAKIIENEIHQKKISTC